MVDDVSEIITSRQSLVEFTSRFVQPPSALYITRDDELRIDVAARTAPTVVRLDARILEPNGRVGYIQHQVRIETAREIFSETVPATEGFLLGGAVKVLSEGLQSWTYAVVGLARGAIGSDDILHGLARGYCTEGAPLVFPNGDYREQTEGRGAFVHDTGADPAATTEINIPVPAAARWRLLGINFDLVASAVAGNRRVILEIGLGSSVGLEVISDFVQGANQTRHYSYSVNGAPGVTIGTNFVLPLPQDAYVDPTGFIRTSSGLLAGDNFTAPEFLIEEWFLL